MLKWLQGKATLDQGRLDALEKEGLMSSLKLVRLPAAHLSVVCRTQRSGHIYKHSGHTYTQVIHSGHTYTQVIHSGHTYKH